MNFSHMRPSSNILDCRSVQAVGIPGTDSLGEYLFTLGLLAFYLIMFFLAAHLMLSLYERLRKTRP